MILTPSPATDESSPPRQPEQVFVYADGSRTKLTQGTPLLITARCDDAELWPSIERAFDAEEFEPFGTSSTVGPTRAQCFRSRVRAWLVVPRNPNAKLAVERTGKSVLSWIAPAPPDGMYWRAKPTGPLSERVRPKR